MKKIKLLIPTLTLVTLTSTIAPITTSCAQVTSSEVIPTDLLDIVGYTLKGFKAGVDLSKYNTLLIPNGIKIIDDNAFNANFVTGTKNFTIQNIIFPNTVTTIKKNAFAGCSSLRTLDFSSWNHKHVYYLNIDEDAFAGLSDVGKCLVNSDVTTEVKAKLQELLTTAGLNNMWFASESEDKMTADAAWKVQKKETGKKANYLFNCNVELKDDTTIYAQVIRTGATKGIDVTVEKLNKVNSKVFELYVSLMNQDKDDEYAEFNVQFVAAKEDGTNVWTQTLTGFKLINVKGTEPEPEPEQEKTKNINLLDDTYTPSYSPAVYEKDLFAQEIADLYLNKLASEPKALAYELRYSLSKYFAELKQKAISFKGIDGDEPKAILSLTNITIDSESKTISCDISFDFHFMYEILENNVQIKKTYDLTCSLSCKNINWIIEATQNGYGLIRIYTPSIFYNRLPKSNESMNILINGLITTESPTEIQNCAYSNYDLQFKDSKWSKDPQTIYEKLQFNTLFKFLQEFYRILDSKDNKIYYLNNLLMPAFCTSDVNVQASRTTATLYTVNWFSIKGLSKPFSHIMFCQNGKYFKYRLYWTAMQPTSEGIFNMQDGPTNMVYFGYDEYGDLICANELPGTWKWID